MSPKLKAPITYILASPYAIERHCNGCGPGGWKFDLVPDNLLGVDISEACNIHDWMYLEGSTWNDRRAADMTMLQNMRTLVRHHGGPLKPIRMIMAWWYWRAVRRYGADAFTSA